MRVGDSSEKVAGKPDSTGTARLSGGCGTGGGDSGGGKSFRCLGQIHRAGGIEDQIEVWGNLLPEEFNHLLITAGIDTPVEVADIVAGVVVTVVVKIERRSGTQSKTGATATTQCGVRQHQSIAEADSGAMVQSANDGEVS